MIYLQNLCRGNSLNQTLDGCVFKKIRTKLQRYKDKICQPEITGAGKICPIFVIISVNSKRDGFHLIEIHLPITIIGIFKKKIRGLIMKGRVVFVL